MSDDPIDRLRDLFDAIDSLDGDGPFRVDTEFDVTGLDEAFGPGADDPRPAGPSRRTSHPGFGRPPDGTTGTGSRDTGGSGNDHPSGTAGPDGTYHVDVREDGDAVEVHADLPGVDGEDISVETAGSDVLVVAAGETVQRVPTGWPAARITDRSYKNGVLSARIRRARGSTDDHAQTDGSDGDE